MASTDDYDIRRFTRAAKGKNGLITIFTVEIFSWDFSWIGIFSTDHGALRSGEFFSVVSFSQVGFPPLISVLSDRGSVFWASQIGGCLSAPRSPKSGQCFHNRDFSQLGHSPSISALSDGGSIFTVGIASTDLSWLRLGEYFHSWDFLTGLFWVGVFSSQGGTLRQSS